MKTVVKSVSTFLIVASLCICFISCDTKTQLHDATPPQQTITYEQANALEEDYIETRYKLLKDTLKIEDTRDFWFSIDTLKKYIAYVEHEAGEKGLSGLGVRVYYGSYPKKSNYPNAGYSTVFIVPTARDAASPIKSGFAPIKAEDSNIEGLLPLNYGGGGIPPNNY
ncbi:hypothetical protein [Ulvibacter litoralis]|uniref:Uncharacterized protein n=1 Tax=Ulvibacter litoralis TaxID=227084 RepID=A0A1G7GIR3_9FLAO|nr:hypothetical protein [Ulvibacter litoralis]GHC56011.1 hypothetical protein GCM10008083_20570 [Ulvibacter litoralis]SDE88052.1 hypothetical protein SAMN05421855_103165 [Ulvibacter litoralis]